MSPIQPSRPSLPGMSRRPDRMRAIQRRGRASRPRLPSLPGIRQPPGYGIADISIRTRGFRGATNAGQQIEPAGEAPDGFPGTKPEWAIYWALTQHGMEHGLDFYFEKMMGGISGSMPWSQVDFVIPSHQIGIEVQGEFWHHGVGSNKIEQDVLRAARASAGGLHLVFIDEDDAIADPIYYSREALAGIDHSKNPAMRGGR